MTDERRYDIDPATRSDTAQEPDRPVAPRPVRTEVVDRRVERAENPEPAATSAGAPGVGAWPELDQYMHRFDELQSEFIQEPHSAVRKAETLVEEAVNRIMGTFQERLRRIHGEAGDSTDTEQLRVAMIRYREFMDSLGSRRAA